MGNNSSSGSTEVAEEDIPENIGNLLKKDELEEAEKAEEEEGKGNNENGEENAVRCSSKKSQSKKAFSPQIIDLKETISDLIVPTYKNNLYENPWDTYETRSLSDVIKWRSNHPVPVCPPCNVLDEKLPVLKTDLSSLKATPTDIIQSVWIGHASFLIQLGPDVAFLTDPVFCQRASPVSLVGPARIRETPFTLNDCSTLPLKFALVSHNHYDHLDISVVQKLKNIIWVAPKAMHRWFKSVGATKVVELGWWEQYQYSPEISITCVPAQHWSKRTPRDDNTVLWGGYIVQYNKKKIYFSGDTGYCTAFKQIGEVFQPIDLALLPIGAYEPFWFMRPQHVNPEQAVLIHKDVGALKSIGMHWGTFILSSEGVFQPPQDLADAKQKHSIKEDEFITVAIGEIVSI